MQLPLQPQNALYYFSHKCSRPPQDLQRRMCKIRGVTIEITLKNLMIIDYHVEM